MLTNIPATTKKMIKMLAPSPAKSRAIQTRRYECYVCGTWARHTGGGLRFRVGGLPQTLRIPSKFVFLCQKMLMSTMLRMERVPAAWPQRVASSEPQLKGSDVCVSYWY